MTSLSFSKRIGLFGGTFDPVHHGHLILARDALELLQLDHLIFLPARISPYKKELPPAASSEERLAMLQLALEGEERFSIDARELKREGPSYTIDTVRELQEEFPAVSFVYLIGEDHLATLEGWKESEELQKRVAFAAFTRSSHGASFSLVEKMVNITCGDTSVFASSQVSSTFEISVSEAADTVVAPVASKKNLSLALLPRCLDISSTEIRERLARGASIRYFVPTTVLDYLEKKSLYRFYA